jgi:hypothetical protein
MALIGVPQSDEISLRFSSPPQRVAAMKLKPALEISFFNSSPSVYCSRHQQAIRSWTIRIYAVDRPLKPNVKKALLEFGLPQAVRPWLIQQGSLSHREGGAWLKLLYDPIQDLLTVQSGSKLLPSRF